MIHTSEDILIALSCGHSRAVRPPTYVAMREHSVQPPPAFCFDCEQMVRANLDEIPTAPTLAGVSS